MHIVRLLSHTTAIIVSALRSVLVRGLCARESAKKCKVREGSRIFSVEMPPWNQMQWRSTEPFQCQQQGGQGLREKLTPSFDTRLTAHVNQ